MAAKPPSGSGASGRPNRRRSAEPIATRRKASAQPASARSTPKNASAASGRAPVSRARAPVSRARAPKAAARRPEHHEPDLESMGVPSAPPAVAAKPERSPWQRHLRRFAPFYALGLIVALMLVIVPTTQRGDDDDASKTGGQVNGGGATPGTGATAGNGPTTGPGGELPGVAIGQTRGGFDCSPGARQLPWSDYAVQCQQKFTGASGGATTRGVTADTIKLLRRMFGETANSQAIAAFGAAAGVAPPEVSDEVRDVFIDYFNSTFELYGRKVVIEDFRANPTANATEEAQSRGKEGACADATKAAEELRAFGVVAGSGPFSECAAERKLVVFQGGAYFPETWYRKYDPYVWHNVMECERISYQVAEYIGKRLAGKKARWAGDPLLQQRTRTFATLVPNNDEYQQCVNISERTLQQQFKVPITSRYNYTLDISRYPDEMLRALLQFKAAGATTLIQASDPIATSFLTQAATAQVYKPEWFLIGTATQDTDVIGRMYDKKQVDGHMFGMSQLSSQHKMWGPDSEPGATYKRITGKNIPSGTTGDYYLLVQIYNFLQSAGPNLTPQAVAAGVHGIMPGGPPGYAIGYVSFADGPDGTAGAGDHTGIDDSREVYWCGTCNSLLDNKPGAYVETYGGRRFRNGEWPQEEPPVYPA